MPGTVPTVPTGPASALDPQRDGRRAAHSRRTGAGSFTRRTLTAATAGALGLLGAVLGTFAGYIGIIRRLENNSLNGWHLLARQCASREPPRHPPRYARCRGNPRLLLTYWQIPAKLKRPRQDLNLRHAV